MLRSKISIVLSFLPLIILMAIAYVWPIVTNFQGSFLDQNGEFAGWDNYVKVFNSYYFWDSLFFSLRISLTATAISVILATVLALALRDTFVGKKIAVFIIQYNLSIPRLAAAMIIVFLVSQTGFLSSITHALGLTESVKDFPWLVYDSSGIGLILVFTWKFVPYIAMATLGILQGASLEYEHQAATLGVGKLKRFVHVLLPTIIPATAVSSILVFASSFGDYEVPAILGSSQHRALSVFVYLKYYDSNFRNQPEAFVLMIVMTLVLTAIIVTYRWLTKRDTRKRGL
jgi:putative spermidine/putrescine transport system permease protein